MSRWKKHCKCYAACNPITLLSISRVISFQNEHKLHLTDQRSANGNTELEDQCCVCMYVLDGTYKSLLQCISIVL